MLESDNVFRDLPVGRVYQDLSHSFCHAIRFGSNVSRSTRSSPGKSGWGSDGLPSRSENGSDGFQPFGRLVDRSKKSANGGAVDPRFENHRIRNDGGRCVGFGGWGVAFKSAMLDVESNCGGDCLFLLPHKEVHVGVTWVSGVGVGNGPCGGVAGGERAV